MRLTKGLILTAALIAIASSRQAFAQDAGVELRLESTTLEVGEAVNGQVICTNIEEPQQPQIPPVDGLDIEVSPTGSRSMSITSINGRTTQRISTTFPVRIVGVKEGSYLVGPVVVSAKSQSFSARAIPVVVRAPQPATQNEGDQLVFVRMHVEPTSLYVTQTLEATLIIGIRKVEIDGKIHELRSLLQLVDAAGSELSVFGPQFSQSTTTLPDSAGNRHAYVLYKDTKTIRAEQVGELKIGPVYVKVDYPLELRRNFWGDLSISRKKKETTRAQAITVEVKAPPPHNRPPSFRGAIGQFAMEVTAKPTRVRQGEPVTLTIAFQGQPVEGLAAPDLSAHHELLSRFDFSADEPVGDIEGSKKVFRKALFPKQPGTQTIPAIEWAYFNPATEQYVVLRSQPIPLEVDPSDSPSTGLEQLRLPGPEPTRLTTTSGGIAPNDTDVHQLLRGDEHLPTPSTVVAALAIPPVAAMTLLTMSKRRQRFQENEREARRFKAFAAARRELRRSRKDRQFSALGAILKRYLTDHFGLPHGELTPVDARRLLEARGLNPATIQDIEAFLEKHDALRYAPNLVSEADIARAADDVFRWIQWIERSA